VHERLSFAELKSLRLIAAGVEGGRVPAEHYVKFEKLGLCERKFGGVVLTAVGRFQLDVRAREAGLSLLANRWRRRAGELRVIAEEMNAESDEYLRSIADRWIDLAERVEKLAALEKQSPSLT
jgi:hypothetical protein